MEALYEAYAAHAAITDTIVVDYAITLTMSHVASDDHWEDIIDDISAALEWKILWAQLAQVVVTLQRGSGRDEGAHTWDFGGLGGHRHSFECTGFFDAGDDVAFWLPVA